MNLFGMQISVLKGFAGVCLALLTAGFTNSASMSSDHSLYEELQGPFDSIEEINTACVGCHNLSESELHDTIHWQWDGKLDVINNYHPNVASNSKACGSCHIGYGLSKNLTGGIELRRSIVWPVTILAVNTFSAASIRMALSAPCVMMMALKH